MANKKKVIVTMAAILAATYVVLDRIAVKQKPGSVYDNQPDQKNPFEGKKVVFIESKNDKINADGITGHLEVAGDTNSNKNFYNSVIKPKFDKAFAFGGLVALSPVLAGIAFAIKLEDPGPVLFTQKRVGKNKQFFKLHKFRSMKMSTPHDVPTHMLENPDQYITKVGKFLRAHSLDELPQIWDIFVGNMSVIGPRPGLWNQDVLTAERDKYGVNDIKPGLTGWAQINGRDELDISEKAKLDGEYVKNIGLKMDSKVFMRSLHVFGKDNSVIEGGTGEMKKNLISRHYIDGISDDELIGHIGFGGPVEVDTETEKRVLITGEGSYIGESFLTYAAKHYPALIIDTVDMIDGSWRSKDFSGYDIIYHVAGIAHADVGNVNEATKENYYAVNTDLAVEVCEKAKAEGAKEFILMSSMIVYGDSAPYGKKKVVDEHTVPCAANFYGDSKLQADVAVRLLADEKFKVIVLRPPMIYGRGSKGNFSILEKIAKKTPIFPDINNSRSMLHIDNLCEFLCQIMLVKHVKENAVVLIPQNSEWTKTTQMVKEISAASGKKIVVTEVFSPVVAIFGRIPGKIGNLINKAFGNSCYDHSVSLYPGINYQITSLHDSLKKTEKYKEGSLEYLTGKRILVVSQYFYPELFRINDMCQEWVRRGHKVTVITGIPNYPMGKTFEGYGLMKKRHEIWNGIEIYRIPLIPRGSSSLGMMMNYASFMVSGVIAGTFKNIKADYVFSFEVSPMTQVLTGITFAKKLGVPHYLYVQDLWPENVITVTGISNPAVIKPIDKMVDYIYKNTDQVFTTSPSFVEAICNRRVPVSRNKVHYWPQYAEDFYHQCEKKSVAEIPDDDSLKIAFTGNIGVAQGLQILPKTAALLKNENIKFIMVGDGRYLEEFNNEVQNHDVVDKFIMIPQQPAERIPELLAACDLAFLSFQNDQLWAMTIPAKLQSYMACGMPVIAAAQGETERIINEAGCGVCSTIGNAEELSQKIKKMMSADLVEMGKRSRAYFEMHFDKQMLMNQIEEYFE